MRILRLSKSSLRFYGWLAILSVITALGFYAIIAGFIRGHEVTFNTGSGVPWGILIVAYLFFVVPASGLCLISSLGHVFGMERFEPLGKRAIFLAIILLISGFLVIASDLERPWLMPLYVLITPNPTSAIWWMGTLYGFYFVALLVEFFFLSRAEAIRRLRVNQGAVPLVYRVLAMGAQKSPDISLKRSLGATRVTGVITIVLAVAALSTLGAVFGLTGSRSLWHGALLPVYFVMTAFLSGDAILIIAILLTHKASRVEVPQETKLTIVTLGQLLGLFLGIFLLFTVWNLLTAQYGRIPEQFESVMILINGSLAIPFWVGEILFGLLAPLAILAYTRFRNIRANVAASLLVVAGIFFTRYDTVIGGQLVPVFGRESLWQYTPSLFEILTVIGAFSLFLILYSLGNHFLPLEDSALVFQYGEKVEASPSPVSQPDVPTIRVSNAEFRHHLT
ncbi:MAG: polysulfide reductase NrfD [Chloroflexi bacterium]|nr:polysulfide reductase NrfD [Chloroflexota bacterium]